MIDACGRCVRWRVLCVCLFRVHNYTQREQRPHAPAARTTPRFNIDWAPATKEKLAEARRSALLERLHEIMSMFQKRLRDEEIALGV